MKVPSKRSVLTIGRFSIQTDGTISVCRKRVHTVIIAAITSRVRKKKKLPTHLYLGQIEGLPANSIILFEQLRTIDKSRLKEHLTHLDEQYLKSLEFPLLISIGVEKRRSL